MIDPLEPRRQFATTGLDPTYGTAGVATTAVAQAGSEPALFTDVIASGFAADGAGYVEARQENPAQDGLEQDYQDRYLLYRVKADGTFDSSFGTDGRIELKTPGDIVGFQMFAVSPSGRLVTNDAQGAYRVFDADGKEQYGASNRLTRTIHRLSGPSYGAKVTFSEKAAFDADGRLLVPGQIADKGNAVALFCFSTYGELDHSFGVVGRGFSRLSSEAINYSPTEVAVGRDGRIALTLIADADTPFGTNKDGATTVTASSIDDAVFSADGTLLSHGRLLSAADPGHDDAEGSSGNYSLRALADGSFASLAHAAANGAVTRLQTDGTVSKTPLPSAIEPPTRLTPAGTLRGWVGRTGYAYPALEGRTDRFETPDTGSYDQFTVLGDGALIAAGVDKTAGVPTLLVQKFDGTGVTPAAASGTAAPDAGTRTLDIEGTSGDDVITVGYSAGRLSVRVNGVSRTFAAGDVDTIHVSGNAGNDTISAPVGRLNVAVRLRGGSGDDVLTTDAYRATIDGGDGTDVGRLTPGSDLNAVGFETLRHPGRRG